MIENKPEIINYFFRVLIPPQISDPSFCPTKGVFLKYAKVPYNQNIIPITPFDNNLKNHKQVFIQDPIEVLMRKIGYEF